MLGKVSHILLQTEFLVPLEQITEQLHRSNRWIGELVHTTRDGRRLTVLARKTLDRDQHGNPASVLENISDITERKRAEAALRLSNERFDIAVKCSHAVLWQQDLELRFTWLHNPAPGIDGSDAVGKRDEDLLERAEDAAVIVGLKREVLRSGAFMRREYFTQIQGVIRCFVVLMEPLRDAAGLIIGLTGAAIDITERKHTEMALQESERQFRALALASSEVIYRMSADWSSMLPLDGRHLVPSSDQPLADWAWLDKNVPPDEHPRVRQAINKAIAQKTLFELEHRIRRPDGSIGWALSRAVPILDENENVITWFGAVSDITERKAAEEAVRAAGERFRFLAESMPQKIFTATARGEVDYYNQQWFEFTGLTFEEIRNWGWTRFIHPDDLEENVRLWKRAIETGDYIEIEHRFRRHDGQYRWHVSRAHAMRDAEGKITMWIGSNTDIHNMMEAQEELIEAEAQLADRAVHLEALVAERTHDLTAAHIQLLTEADERKRLETEIASTIESERARLGQELHDGLVQELTGIGMMMHVLAQALTKSAPKRASEARRLCLMLEQSHGNARDLAKCFYPVELEQYGLVAALEEIAQRAEKQSGVSCVVQADENAAAPVKDAIKSVQLFRIAQEAVQNACKHAQATEILICLSKRDGAWLLTVKDNGMGLLDNGRKDGGMGLRIMQYRARIIGGKLSVSNAEDGGVIVSCSAPAGDTDKVPAGKIRKRLKS